LPMSLVIQMWQTLVEPSNVGVAAVQAVGVKTPIFSTMGLFIIVKTLYKSAENIDFFLNEV